MKPSRLRWGLLFITVGVMLLLNNAGYLDWEYWLDLLVWWPLLLIAIGIEKIFLRSKLEFISYLAPLILVVCMVYVAFDTGAERYESSFFERYSWSTDADPSVERVDATIEHRRADLYVSRDNFDLASARFDRFSRKPDIDFSKSDGVAELKISRRGRMQSAIVINTRHYGRDWRLAFSDDVPLKLKCIGDKSDVNLNLEEVPLENLAVENDEGDIYLKIGRKMALVDVSAEGYDADLRIKLPEGCGVKVPGDNYASYLRTVGLTKQETAFVSEGFEEADVKITLNLAEDLRHLSIDYY